MLIELMTDKSTISIQNHDILLRVSLLYYNEQSSLQDNQAITSKENEPGIVARLRNSLANESTCSLLGICYTMYESDIIRQNIYQQHISKHLHTR